MPCVAYSTQLSSTSLGIHKRPSQATSMRNDLPPEVIRNFTD